MFFSLPSPKHVLLQNGCSNSFKELCLYKKAISGSENAKRWQSLRRHLWSWRRRECRGLSSQTIKIQSPERVSQKSRETKEDELRIYMNLWSVMICHRKKLAVVAPSFTADCVETLEDKHVLWILLHFRNESVNNAAKWCTTMHNAEHVLLFTWSGAWHNWPRGIPRSWRGRTRHEPQNSRDQTFKTWISLANLDLPFQTELHITHITVRRSFVGHVSAIEELYMSITHHVARCCTMLHVLQLGSIAIGLTDSLWHTLPPLPFASGSIEVVIPCLNSQDHWVRRPKTASAAISGDLISTF